MPRHHRPSPLTLARRLRHQSETRYLYSLTGIRRDSLGFSTASRPGGPEPTGRLGVGGCPEWEWRTQVLFLQRLLLHYGIYRRYPLRPWPAFKNAWRIAFR